MLALERRLREALTEDKISCASRPCDFPALTENETDWVFVSPHSNLHEATKEFDAIIAGPPYLTLLDTQIPQANTMDVSSVAHRPAGEKPDVHLSFRSLHGMESCFYTEKEEGSHISCAYRSLFGIFDSSSFFLLSFDVERILRQASQESPGNNVKPRQASIDPFVASRVLGSCFHLAALVLAKTEQHPPSPLCLSFAPPPPLHFAKSITTPLLSKSGACPY
ncbi:hypothetical protein HDV62DRAFT_287684 [Trichoderma sp. SZMC 28011]